MRVFWLMTVATGAALCTAAYRQGARLPDVTYMDQPTGIEPTRYIAAWPALTNYIERVRSGQATAVESELKQQLKSGSLTDGELNLLAQLAWHEGDLDPADAAIAKALALGPRESLNAFQAAMVTFAHLRRATSKLEQWRWQRRTRDAYQRTMNLDATNVSARYYLAYTYMNTPWIGGGDKQKALELSQQGISLGESDSTLCEQMRTACGANMILPHRTMTPRSN